MMPGWREEVVLWIPLARWSPQLDFGYNSESFWYYWARTTRIHTSKVVSYGDLWYLFKFENYFSITTTKVALPDLTLVSYQFLYNLQSRLGNCDLKVVHILTKRAPLALRPNLVIWTTSSQYQILPEAPLRLSLGWHWTLRAGWVVN